MSTCIGAYQQPCEREKARLSEYMFRKPGLLLIYPTR